MTDLPAPAVITLPPNGASEPAPAREPAGPSLRKLIAADVAAGLLIGFLLARSAIDPQLSRPFHVPIYLGIVDAVVAAAAISLRRIAPLTMLAIAELGCAFAYLGGFERDPHLATGLVMYLVATQKSRRTSLIALVACVAAIVLSFALTPPGKNVFVQAYDSPHLGFLTQSVSPVAVQCAAWAIGFAVRRQRGYLVAVRAQAEDQMRVQREQSWRTATEERLRIARELHDVVAHGMSVITVQAGVGGHLLDERPEQARAALAVIETTGREALQELRQLLGVLRDDAAEPARAPAPSIADLDDVVRRVRQAGTVVDLQIRGERRALSGGVELSAYRIVQEALTNVVKHAHTDRCRVRLTYGDDALDIEVTDDGVGAGSWNPEPGHGMIGMRERAALHGGTFEAGPLPLRGYRVAVGLPLGGGA